MTLYRKALLIMVTTTAIVMIASFVVAETVLMPGLRAHEQNNVQERIQTLSAGVERAIADLERVTSDYAAWDRTYGFIARPDADYARVELNDPTFEKYDIQLVMIVGLDDRLVLRKAFKAPEEEAVAGDDLEALRTATHQCVAMVRDEVGVSGIVAAPSGPYMVSMRPILTSAGTGPVRGMVAMARRIGRNELGFLSEIVHAPVIVVRQSNADLSRRHEDALQFALHGKQGWLVRRPAEIDAYYQLIDLNGKRATALRLTTDRELYHRSRRVIWSGAMLVAGVALLLGLGQLWFLHTLILARMRRASRAVAKITAANDLSIRIPPTRNDELGQLAAALNQLLAELERSRNEMLQLNALAQHDANHDALTGLKNRRAVLSAAAVEMGRASRQRQKMALLLVDIDHFKRINDSHGHVAGDVVLKSVGNALEAQLRPYDAVGRYGGEEFLVVVPGVNHVRAMEVAERLRMSVAEQVKVAAHGDAVTISVGVAVTTGEESLEHVVEAADRAMYAAKAGGRNRVELDRPRKPIAVVDLDDRIREYSSA